MARFPFTATKAGGNSAQACRTTCRKATAVSRATYSTTFSLSSLRPFQSVPWPPASSALAHITDVHDCGPSPRCSLSASLPSFDRQCQLWWYWMDFRWTRRQFGYLGFSRAQPNIRAQEHLLDFGGRQQYGQRFQELLHKSLLPKDWVFFS